MTLHLANNRQGFPEGMTWVTKVNDPQDNTGIAFGVYRMKAGETAEQVADGETAWLLMTGSAAVSVGNVTKEWQRQSIFDESPKCIHVPSGTTVRLRAEKNTEFTVYRTANAKKFEPKFYDTVANEHRGKGQVGDACLRFVRTIFDRTNSDPNAELVLGEVITMPGRWSSYPPHHHAQPEIYHYRFTGPQGYGLAENGPQVFRVKQYDTVKIFDGNDHAQTAAPGYGMYYAWVIRHLPDNPYGIPDFTEEHKWVMDKNAAFWFPEELKDGKKRMPREASARLLDLICFGRAAADLYAEQLGARLEDVSSFSKYIGGCAANIAVGTARLGLKSSMLTRVGDDHMGRFVRETLQREGVDTGHVSTDPQRLTGLVLLGIKDRDTFPLIFYRENCADMAVEEKGFDLDYIASAKALLVTGTHFSTEHINQIGHRAIAFARQAGTKVIFDIDYRPVLWGLIGRGMGEVRYIASHEVSAHLQKIVPHCDLIVGTEEEHCIAGGSDDIMTALRNTRTLGKAEIVVKRGPLGCSVFPGSIGQTLDDGITVKGVTVEVLNVLGAGDAFMSGYLRGWINGESTEMACTYANACGALVVSRHGCAPAMPSKIELDDYLSRAKDVTRPDLDQRLNHLHRVTNRAQQWPQVMALAFDHRSQCEALVKEVNQPASRIGELKAIIAQAVLSVAKDFPGRAGVLVDGRFGQSVLEHVTGRGLWIGRPVELPGSRPLRFEAGPNIAQEMRAWPAEQTAKCLVFYHPDDPATLKREQLETLSQLQEACIGTGHDLLIEVIPPKSMPRDETTLPRVVAEIYAHGLKPDWWKLPSMGDEGWRGVTQEILANDPYCRGVVLLGLEAPEDELAAAFKIARHHPICKGFAIGRSIFMAPARDWLLGKLDADAFAANVAENYRRLIEIWLSPQSAAA